MPTMSTMALGHGMDGGRGVGDAGGMQDRDRDLGADGGGKLEIGCRGQPHGRPDFGARLVVDGGAADDADEVDEARRGVGAGDLQAVLLVQAAREQFVARHADADDVVVADGAATALENLETEAHAVGEAAAIAVAPAFINGDQNCSMSVPAWVEISTPSRSPSLARRSAAA